MARTVTGTVSASTQINTSLPSGTSGSGGAQASGGGSNVSSTSIQNSSKNQFWEQLEKNIQGILHETDKVFPEGSSETVIEQANSQTATGAAALPQGSGQRAAQVVASALQTNPAPGSSSHVTGNTLVRRSTFREAASVMMNPESGVVTVRATSRQHEKIQEFIDRVTVSSHRQVLIEATIVEVALGDGYQQGINWSRIVTDGVIGKSFAISQASINSNVGSVANPFTLTFKNQKDTDTTISSLVNVLQSFGTAKVLSSPRLSVMNNQTALLRVVENYTYFLVKSEIATTGGVGINNQNNQLKATTTTPQTVSVGLVMTVTPQVSENGTIILNVRPSISSITELKADPNPELKEAGVQNLVPQISTREIESVMRVNSGEIAVLGGLMKDSIDWKTGRVPLLSLIHI